MPSDPTPTKGFCLAPFWTRTLKTSSSLDLRPSALDNHKQGHETKGKELRDTSPGEDAAETAGNSANLGGLDTQGPQVPEVQPYPGQEQGRGTWIKVASLTISGAPGNLSQS